MLSATKQTTSIKLATKVGHFLRDLDLDFDLVLFFPLSRMQY